MIKLKKLEWSNVFSYGPNNSIQLDKHSLVQLIGSNGHGKSSIALVLEEILYNKNSKGTKRGKVLNRYTKSNKYTIKLEFTKGNTEYVISTSRGATQSVTLLENGKDISAHTATATYKLIENILGLDHKAFTQIVYQSSAYSLEFLTATDSNRKKFLIDLLDLSRYTDKCDTFKSAVKETSNKIEVLLMKQKHVDSWLDSYKPDSVKKLALESLPDDTEVNICKQQLSVLQNELSTLDSTKKKIIQNNKYKEIIKTIDISPVDKPSGDLLGLKVSLSEAENRLAKIQAVIKGTGPILTNCPTCGQPVDNSHKKIMLEEAKVSLPEVRELVSELKAKVQAYTFAQLKFDSYVKNQREWENYYSLIDQELTSKLPSVEDLSYRINSLENTILEYNSKVKSITSNNAKASAHNARADVLIEQHATMVSEKKEITQKLQELQSLLSTQQILVKSFSTSGLVAYKIECLVKDLENLSNEYLESMSDGRFQLGFVISTSDKLDVVITDNGRDIDITDLSNGELARVNISTLLAIRKLLQSLSNTKINLLILDETIGNLDAEGKDRLIEVLLKEEFLNTFIISHGFSHPLLEKINVIKENNISRIE